VFNCYCPPSACPPKPGADSSLGDIATYLRWQVNNGLAGGRLSRDCRFQLPDGRSMYACTGMTVKQIQATVDDPFANGSIVF
jgi:hypothetical protein